MPSGVLPDRAFIRAARGVDRPFLADLSERVFARYSRSPRRGLARMLEMGTALIAEHQLAGQAIRLGFAIIEVSTRHAAIADFLEPRLAHLSAIAVCPEAMGCGIGRQLLEAAEEVAREQGAIAMSLLTAETNTTARALFESAGYSTILLADAVYIDEQDGLHMLKSLTLDRE